MAKDVAASSLFGLSQRLPPSNIPAEQALLGAILANNRAMDLCAGLEPEHFADPINGAIYRQCQRLTREGRLVDAVTLKNVFEGAGVLDEVGGTAYLTQLLSAMVGIINAPDYARAIRDTFLRRELITAMEAAAHQAWGADPNTDGQGVITGLTDRLLDLGEKCDVWQAADIGVGIDAACEATEAAYKGTGPKALLTGLEPLDALWGGLYPKSLDFLGARSGHGKTALGVQIMRNVAERFLAEHLDHLAPFPKSKDQPKRCQFFSLEMPREDIGFRMLATETGIEVADLRAGRIGGNRAERIIQARAHLNRLPISIHDRPGQTIGDIQSAALIGVRRRNVKLIVIDHLHRIAPTREMTRMPRADQVPAIAALLKDLANTLGVPILLLCQLVKDVDRREDPRPVVSDIKYATEADADNIILVWRPEMHMPERTPPINAKLSEEKQAELAAQYHAKRMHWRGKAEFVAGKRRAGDPGRSCVTAYIGATTTFAPLAGGDDLPPDDAQTGLF